MYCRKCGKQIDDNAKFCRFCGNEIKSEPGMMKKIEKEAEKKVEKKAEKKVEKKVEKKIRKKKSPVKALILIIVILLLILLVAGGILLVANGTFKNIQETLKNTTETEMDEQQDKVPDEKDEKEEVSEPKETDQQEEVEEVATENEKNTAKAEEKANIIDEGWRQAYADYLYRMMNDQNSILYTDSSNTYNSGVGFTIAYIDEDNIPELIIRYTDKLHVGGAVLCAYSKGNVMTLQKSMGQWGYFNYVERQGIVSVPYTGTETETSVTYYRLEGLAFKEECTMSKMNPNSKNVTFYVDENEVTKEKYQEKENEYIQGYQPWKGVELNDLNVENIGRILGADTTGFNDPKQQDYILPGSSQMYLTDEDVSALSAEQLRIARNEIYARHGYIFRSEDLQTYFSGKEWYSPSVLADNFSDEMLSALELANLDLIKKYEEMRKSETN